MVPKAQVIFVLLMIEDVLIVSAIAWILFSRDLPWYAIGIKTKFLNFFDESFKLDSKEDVFLLVLVIGIVLFHLFLCGFYGIRTWKRLQKEVTINHV